MSFAESLSEIPRLSFAERQEWVRSAIAVDDAERTAEENALPDARRSLNTNGANQASPGGHPFPKAVGSKEFIRELGF